MARVTHCPTRPHVSCASVQLEQYEKIVMGPRHLLTGAVPLCSCRALKSHINVCVYDSTWEACDAFALDDSDAVGAWVKNDHLGFEILYVYRGVVRKYRPDFLIRLKNGDMLVLETKGQDAEQDKVKRRYLDEWTQAVNAHGGFGRWRAAVVRNPGEIRDTLLACGTEGKQG